MTIEEHITEYERRWNFMKVTLGNSGFPDKAKEFGKHLKGLSETEVANTESSYLAFHHSTVQLSKTCERMQVIHMAILSTNASYIFQLGSVEIKEEKRKRMAIAASLRYSRLNAMNEIRLNRAITAKVKDGEE
jgi:hypothetical protein